MKDKRRQPEIGEPANTERISLRATGRRLRLYFDENQLSRISYVDKAEGSVQSLSCETRKGKGDFVWRGYSRAFAVVALLMRASFSAPGLEPTIYGGKRSRDTGVGSAVSAFLDSYDQATNPLNAKRLFPGNLTLVFYGSKHKDRKLGYRWVTLDNGWLTPDCIEIFTKRNHNPEEITKISAIVALARAIEQQENWHPSQDADNWNNATPAPMPVRAEVIARTSLSTSMEPGAMGERKTPENTTLYLDPVDSPAKHGDMWRWNQRMFRSRHPGRFKEFDLVGLELGRNWWERYPEQDWVLRDWTHEQIGQYSLCPISEDAFSALANGSIKESDLSPGEIIDAKKIQNHAFWYLAAFLRAKVAPGIPSQIAEHCSNTMLQHILSRALQSDHFATSQGRDIAVVTIVEAKSLEKFAQKYRFGRSIPYATEAGEEKVYQALWSKKQIEFALSKIEPLQGPAIELILSYRNQGGVLFQQPPHYG